MSDEEERESTLGVLPLPPDGVFTEEDRESTLGILPLEEAGPEPEAPVLRGGGIVYVSKAKRRRLRKQRVKEAKRKPLPKRPVRLEVETPPLVLDFSELENIQELIALYEQEKAILDQQARINQIGESIRFRQQQALVEAEQIRQQAILAQRMAVIKQRIDEEETFLLLAIAMA